MVVIKYRFPNIGGAGSMGVNRRWAIWTAFLVLIRLPTYQLAGLKALLAEGGAVHEHVW